MLRFAHLEFQVFIGQVLGLSVLSLELTKTHCLLNGVLDVNLGFIVLPLVHVKQFERNVASTNVWWDDAGDYWLVECWWRFQAA